MLWYNIGMPWSGSKSVPIKESLLRAVSIDDIGDCWIWQGAINHRGYGNLRGRMAHRISYELFVGEIPKGLQLDHLCLNKACVNFTHLEPVTNRENKLRWAATLTHCPSGHEYTGKNVFVDKIGTKRCKECSYGRVRDWAKRNKEKTAEYSRNYYLKRKSGRILPYEREPNSPAATSKDTTTS